MATLVQLLFLLVFTFFCYVRFWPYIVELRRRRKIAANIAGPTTSPLLGNALQFSRNPFEFLEHLLRLANEAVQSGEHLLRLWVADKLVVFPLDGEALKPMIESNTELVKGRDYDFFRPWLGDGLLTSSGNKWKSRRKMLTPAFHFKMLQEFVSVFDTESKVLLTFFVREFSKKFLSSSWITLRTPTARWIFCPSSSAALLTLSAVRTAMGVKVNAQIKHDSPYVTAVEKVTLLGFEYSITPFYWLQPVWYASGKAQETKNAVEVLKSFTEKVVKERRANYSRVKKVDLHDKKKAAFLDMLLEMQYDNKLSDEGIREEVDTFMFADDTTCDTKYHMDHNENEVSSGVSTTGFFVIYQEALASVYNLFVIPYCQFLAARGPGWKFHREATRAIGHDTTSTGIGWTLWCLATHPDVQEKAIEEVDSIFGDGEMRITIDSLQQLKYVERCIKEAMRLFAPVPHVQRQLKNDILMGGKIVPRGTNCIISPILVHRNLKVFPNANDFDVDNFLPERIAQRHPYSYIPFSAGPRNCIGQKFALLEEKTVIVSILRAFTMKCNLKLAENRCGAQVVLRPEQGFPIIFERRQTYP
uniref:Cytochrome P450 n=1 Tax=Ascaris lumbricoides TaxID=6252 RepID=A0A9J2PWC6_ASCLU